MDGANFFHLSNKIFMNPFIKSYAEQLESLADQYRIESGATSINLNDVASWAYEKGLWKPYPQDVIKLLANQLSRALRSIHKRDPQGRTVRSHIAMPIRVENQTVFEWFKPENMSYEEMRASSQYRRGLVANDVKQLDRDNQSWNDNYSDGTLLEMDFNFNLDLRESESPDTHPDFEVEDENEDDEIL